MQKALKHLLFISRKPGSGSEHSKSKVEKNSMKHKRLKKKNKNKNTNTVKIINKRAIRVKQHTMGFRSVSLHEMDPHFNLCQNKIR